MMRFVAQLSSEPARRLLAASFLALYFELLFIRWLPSAVHVIAFFGNTVLISAVLGLGIGMGSRRQIEEWRLIRQAMLAMVCLVAFVLALSWLDVGVPYDNQELALNEGLGAKHAVYVNLYVLIGTVFLVTALCFLPTGRLMGYYLAQMEPLAGYSVDILGSLMGILAFTGMAALSFPPAVWLGLGFGLFALCFPAEKMQRLGQVALAVGLVAVVGVSQAAQDKTSGAQTHWSPYYHIRVWHNNQAFRIHVNDNFLLVGANFGPTGPPQWRFWGGLYDLPHKLFEPKKVLVLGAGGGNDVAAALRNGADHVDAVEIDPEVIKIGTALHPERPYSDPRVTVINDDARSYLRKTKEKYDLVIFGILDSHSLFSSMSSIKLENYVYTRDCFRDALNVLKPDGSLYLIFHPWVEWLRWRLYATLYDAAGEWPVMLRSDRKQVVLLAGAAARNPQLPEEAPVEPLPHSAFQEAYAREPWVANVPTDDRPHLYLKHRKIPVEYLTVIGLLFALGFGLVLRETGVRAGFSPHYFFLGSGFLLIETTSIASLGLLMGATWQTNCLVISSILLMIFLANMVLLRFHNRVNLHLAYVGLLASLVFLYFFRFQELLGDNPLVKLGVAAVLIGLPMLGSAIVFGTSFARTTNSRAALASNMLSAVFGGLMEYSSMVVGLQALYLVAAGVYVISWVTLPRHAEAGGQPSQE